LALDDTAIITGLCTVAGSAVTGVLTYVITNRGINASNDQGAKQRAHDAEQREADRLTQLRAVQLAAHDASVRRAYIVVQTMIRFTEDWLVWMRISVVTGTEGTAPMQPADTDAAYAEIDLTISGKSREAYLALREAQKNLENAYAAVKEHRESISFSGPNPARRAEVRTAFFTASTRFSECSTAMTEQMREDLDPGHLT
jgi:hypothetical protein